MSSPPATVYVVDDDSLACEMIAGLVQTMRLGYERFESGHDFLDGLDGSRPGCVITEVRLPDVGGFGIQEALAIRQVPLPVIFLTSHAAVPLVVRAMRNGAVSFLEKPPNEHDLWEAIQEAVRESRVRGQVLAERLSHEEQLDSLDVNELGLLRRLADGESARTIAEQMRLSVRTIELRRSKLMRKLGAATQTELLRFAFNTFDVGHEAIGGEDVVEEPNCSALRSSG